MKRIVLTLLMPLLLTGCFMTPGKFTSELELMSGDRFAFTYVGEIQFIALSKLSELGSSDEFTAQCEDEDGFARECSEEETSEQRAEWDAGAQERAAKKARNAEQMKLMMGGLDPSDPQAAEEFAEKLRRQRGWNRVDYKADGLFDVSFSIKGTLTHDFAFPSIEKMPAGASFLNVSLRNDGQVRIDAPGFASQGAGNPMAGMMGGMMGLAQLGAQYDAAKSGEAEPPALVLPQGTFRIVTDGRVLANNTDEGAAGPASRQVLSWAIEPSTEAAPTALIAF